MKLDLSLHISSFSVNTFKAFRNDVNKAVGYLAVPEYKNLAKKKPDCRPSGITITGKGHDIKAPMQDTLEHTSYSFPEALILSSILRSDIRFV